MWDQILEVSESKVFYLQLYSLIIEVLLTSFIYCEDIIIKCEITPLDPVGQSHLLRKAENFRLSNKEINLLYTWMLTLVQPKTASVLSHRRGVFNILFIYFTYSNITGAMKHQNGWNINKVSGQIKKFFKQIE